MKWGFWNEVSRFHFGLLLVHILLVLHLQTSSGQLDLGICLNNVKSADSNRDGFLNMSEYLDLIELYDISCDLNSTELSSKQVEVFMQLSHCPCKSDPYASSSCCTPETSNIDVQAAFKGIESLTLLEQIGLNLLCLHAWVFARDIICSESRSPTNIPSQEPLEEPSDEPSKQPSPEISQSPTKVTTVSPALPPTTGLEIPTAPPLSSPPITGPTNLPTLPLTVNEPTLPPIFQTNSPILPPTTGLEIPSLAPVVLPTLPIPTLPVNSPTVLPSLTLTIDEPSRSPSLPSSSFSGCMQDLKAADVNKDQQLTLDEFTVFLRKLADCTGISEGNTFIAKAFLTIQCFGSSIQNLLACISSTLDISAAYVPVQQQTFDQTSRVHLICDVSTVALLTAQDCVDVPTPAPVQVPVVVPKQAPVSLPTTLRPAESPSTVIPTAKPSASPTIIKDEPRTPAPTASPTSSSYGDEQFLACTSNLVIVDTDSDALLSQAEYLNFIRQQSACDSITALSSAQDAVFNSFAGSCLFAENADPNCALPRNARVSIDGAATADDLRTDDQRRNLKNLCIETENVLSDTCTQAPAFVAPPFGSPSTEAPVTPPSPVPGITPTQAGSNQPQASSTTSIPVDVVPGVLFTLAPTTPSSPQIESGTVSPLVPISEPVSGSGSTPQPATDIPPSDPVVTSTVSPVTGVERPMAAPSTDLPMSAPMNGQTLLPEDCSIAMIESDIDQDSYLNQEEFLQFVQLYSQCNLTTLLSDEQNTVFQTLACACLNVREPDCCLPGNAKVSISQNSVNSYFDADICSLTSATFDDDCVASPTMSPINPMDLDQCALDLVRADVDSDGLLTKAEYLEFIRKYGQDYSVTSLDLGHQSVFQTISCECVKYASTYECCLPGNATLNISGAGIPNVNRSGDQIATLSKICLSADGLTARDCSAPLVAAPSVDCADDLVASDINMDGYLDMDEYLLFFRKRFIDCADIEWLSFTQRISFNVLACYCLLKPGAQLDCCFPENARVDISGANLSDADRSANKVVPCQAYVTLRMPLLRLAVVLHFRLSHLLAKYQRN
jgi:hypothetical protein